MKLNVKTTCITLAILICALFAVRAVTISLEGEKGYLKRTIHKIKRLAERESMLALTNYISPNYYDELGNDRRSLLLIAKGFFGEYKNILIAIDTLEIEIEDGSASAHIEATVYWQEDVSSDIIYDTVEVEAKFKKERNSWKLIELRFFEPEKKLLFSPMIG